MAEQTAQTNAVEPDFEAIVIGAGVAGIYQIKRLVDLGIRATVLDAVEPEANASLHPRTLRAMRIAPGDLIKIETRRGSITIMARADRAVAEDMVFVPFAYVEAAANVLTNPQLDPYGKIPEFKFSACRVAKARAMAAE